MQISLVGQKEMTKERKAYMKTYRITHYEQCRAYDKAYKIAKREQLRAYDKAYRIAHPEQSKAKNKAYYENHLGQAKAYANAFKKTPKGKVIVKRSQALRKKLGFIPQNEYFEGSHAHHIDKERVIYIPQELHKNIHHSVLKNVNMEKINTIAFEFLTFLYRPEELEKKG